MPIITNQQLAPKGLKFGEQTTRSEAKQRLQSLSSENPLNDYRIATSAPKSLMDYTVEDFKKLDPSFFGNHTLNRYSHLTNYFKHYTNLSDEEKENFKERMLPKYGQVWDSLTDDDKDILFKNNLYIDIFGIDDFKSKSSEERDKNYRDNILPLVMAGIFGNSSDKFALIQNMTSEGQLEVLKEYQKGNLWLKPKEFKSYVENKLDDIESFKKAHSTTLHDFFSTDDVMSLKVDVRDEYEKLIKQNIADSFTKSEGIFQNILREDSKRKVQNPKIKEEADKIYSQLYQDWRNIFQTSKPYYEDNAKFKTPQAFESYIDEILGKSNYYKAFKDSDVLSDFSLDKKIRLASEVLALQNSSSPSDADTYVEAMMQAEVYNNQTGWDWAENTAKQVAVGGVANIMNTVNGVTNVGYAIADGAQTLLTGERSMLLENHLRGLDRNGQDMGRHMFNPQYWRKVEEYNTFSYDDILKADANSGISQYNNVYTPDVDTGEFNGYQMLNETFAMSKFLWSDMLMMAVGGAALRGGAALAGARFMSEAGQAAKWFSRGAMLNSEMSTAFGRGLYEVGSKGLAALSATGISESYGMMTFNQIYEEGKNNIESLKQQEIQNAVDGYINDPSTQHAIEELVKRKMANVPVPTPPIKYDGKLVQKVKDSFGITINSNTDYESEVRKYEEAVRKYEELREKYRHDYERQLREGYTEQISLEIESRYAQQYDELAHAAANGYMVDATIEQLRMGAVNSVFKSYLFDKGTRMALLGNKNPYLQALVSDAQGKLSIGQKALKKGFKVGGGAVSGFTSNYFDDVWVSASKGLGLYQFNNHLIDKYGAEQFATATGDYIAAFVPSTSSLDAMMNGVREGMLDKQSFYDGLIGMASFFSGGMPSGKFIMEGASLRQNKEGQKISLAEGLNKYWNIGILNSLAEQNSLIRTAQTEIDKANDILINKWVPQIDLLPEIISSLDYYNQSRLNGGMMEIKDSKAQMAFNIAQMLMTNNELLSQSAKVTNAQQFLQNIVEDKLSTDDKLKLISAIKGQPQNKNISDISDVEAFSIIQENAEAILNMQQSIRDALELVSKAGWSNTMNDREVGPVVLQLAYEKAMLGNWNNRLQQIEAQVRGNEGAQVNHTSSYYNASVIGTEKAHIAEKQALEDTISDLNKRKKGREKAIESLKKRLEKTNSEIERKSIQEKINVIQLHKDAIDYRLRELENNLNTVNTNIESNYYDRVLSVEEILQLDPKSRARMLNPNNIGNYSKEQQDIINQAITQLINQDPSVLLAIQDAATLFDRISDTERSFESIITHPEEALAYVNGVKEDRYYKVQRQFQYREMNEYIASLEEAKEKGDEYFNSVLKRHRSTTLEEFNKRHPELANIVSPYITRNKYIEELFDVVDEVVTSDVDITSLSNEAKKQIIEQSKLIKENILALSTDALTPQEVLDALENAIDNPTLPEEVRNQVDEVLNVAQQIGMQRDATKVQSREEKRKLAEEQEKIRLENIQKAKVAQQKAEETLETKTVSEEAKQEVTEEPTKEVKKEPKEYTESPEEQVAKLEKSTIIDTSTKNELPKEDDQTQMQQSTVLAGNVMRTYEIGNKIQKRQGKEPNDKMNRFFNWLDSAGIKLQEIIDLELGTIKQFNPTVHFLTINPKQNSTNDDAMNDFILLALKVDDNIKRIHKEERGGVVRFNGEEYLIIGTAGYSSEVKNGRIQPIAEQQIAFRNLSKKLIGNRKNYFDSHSNERFYVDEYNTTEIKDITSGRLVTQIEGDEAPQIRPVSQLMYNEDGSYNEERNPQHLAWEDLVFGISMASKFAIVGREGISIMEPKESGIGNTYLMIKTPNGKYTSVMLRPIFTSEIANGKLKQEIMSLLRQMTSPNMEERKEAKQKLSNYIYMDEKGNNTILYDDYSLTIKSNGAVYKSFVLNDSFNPQDFVNAALEANFRINLTANNLMSVSYLKMLDEAGALSTEAARLATYNAFYSIYNVEENGNPMKNQPIVGEMKPEKGGVHSFRESSYHIKDKTYRERNGVIYDVNGKPVTDTKILQDIAYIKQTDSMESTIKDGVNDVYIINSDKNNPEVIGRTKNSEIIRYSTEKALELLAKTEEQARLQEVNKVTEKKNQPVVNQVTETQVKTQTEVKEKTTEVKEKIQGFGKKSLKDLQNSEKSFTFVQLTRNPEHRKQVSQTLTEKFGEEYTKLKPNEREAFLKSKGIKTDNIEDVNAWCELIKNCK